MPRDTGGGVVSGVPIAFVCGLWGDAEHVGDLPPGSAPVHGSGDSDVDASGEVGALDGQFPNGAQRLVSTMLVHIINSG